MDEKDFCFQSPLLLRCFIRLAQLRAEVFSENNSSPPDLDSPFRLEHSVKDFTCPVLNGKDGDRGHCRRPKETWGF